MPKTIEELAEHDFVVFRTLATALPVKLKAVVQTDDVFFTHQATLAGLGIGAMASFLAKADVESGALVPVLPRWSKEVGSLFFVHPKTQHTPRKVTALRDFIIEHLRNHPLCPEPV